MKELYYKKVFISGKKENLPKEDGDYFAYDKSINFQMQVLHFEIGDNWNDIDWYLQPISEQDLIEYVRKSNKKSY